MGDPFLDPFLTLTYNLGLSGTDASTLVSGIVLPTGATITDLYDSVARMTATELLYGTNLDYIAYAYNTINQRTSQVRGTISTNYGVATEGGTPFGFPVGTIFRIVITPTNAPIPALQFRALSAGNLSFGFTAAAGQSYFLQQSTNLATANWTFFTNLVGAGSFVQLSVPATNDAQLFRLREP